MRLDRGRRRHGAGAPNDLRSASSVRRGPALQAFEIAERPFDWDLESVLAKGQV